VEEAKVMLDCGAERVVVGALTAEGRVDEVYLEAMCEAVGSENLVWHRAIDASADPDADVSILLQHGVKEMLSSGGCARAVEGLAALKRWTNLGMGIVAGGGVRPEDVSALREAGVVAVHASCRATERQGNSPLFDTATHPVDYAKVLELVESTQP
jgi:copper homeostasis protein